MQQKTQQIKAYKLNVTQTSRDGAFPCPCCGAKISPDDRRENAYIICDVRVNGNNLDEIVLYCKRCLSFIHLCGFSDIYKHTQLKNLTTTALQDNFYISHV